MERRSLLGSTGSAVGVFAFHFLSGCLSNKNDSSLDISVSNISPEKCRYKLKLYSNGDRVYQQESILSKHQQQGDTDKSVVDFNQIETSEKFEFEIKANDMKLKEEIRISCGSENEGAFITIRIFDDYIDMNSSDC
jgi:hypothetical protein